MGTLPHNPQGLPQPLPFPNHQRARQTGKHPPMPLQIPSWCPCHPVAPRGPKRGETPAWIAGISPLFGFLSSLHQNTVKMKMSKLPVFNAGGLNIFIWLASMSHPCCHVSQCGGGGHHKLVAEIFWILKPLGNAILGLVTRENCSKCTILDSLDQD